MNFRALHQTDLTLMPDNARPNLCEDTRGIVAVDGADVRAIAVFDNWSFNSCQIHIYIANPFVLKHGFAREVFNYAFNTCGKGMVIGVTAADNAKALKFIKNIGLVEIFRIPEGHKKGVDFVITQLRKENCIWTSDKDELNAARGY